MSLKLSEHIRKITIPIHLLALVTLILTYKGYLSTTWLPAFFVGWILICGYGIAIGYHRLISHYAFNTSPRIRSILAYLGCLGGQGSPLFWAAVHRGSHHLYSDTDKDLHSPIHGKFHAYIGWQFTLKPSQVPFRSTVDLMKIQSIVFLHKNYYKVYYTTFFILLAIKPELALYGMILPSIVSMHQENCVDLFCHLSSFGYRNYETKDLSRNVFLIGYLGFGQGWHNNHHYNPNTYDYGNKWYEFDICKFLVWPLLRKKI